MDLEERKRHLAELQAARKAKQRQLERIAQSTTTAASTSSASPSSAATGGVASVEPSAPPTRDSTSAGAADTSVTSAEGSTMANRLGSALQPLSIVSNVGQVEIAPTVPEKYDREVETDPTFVYTEERLHPDEVVAKETFAELQETLKKAKEQQEESLESSAATAASPALQHRGFVFVDKSSTAAAKKMCRTPAFVDFVSRAVAATDAVWSSKNAIGGSGASATALDNQTFTANGSFTMDPPSTMAVKLLRRATFVDSALCKDRVVASISFQSQRSSELFLVAMSAPEGGSTSGWNGLVLLWNARRINQSPLQFVCADEVRVATFSTFHDHLIIGGTASGRIVCWNALGGQEPTLISFPSPDSHRCAILSAVVRGDANSNQLTTVCQEGRVCTWQTDQPRRPITSRENVANGNVLPGRILAAASFVSSARAELSDAARLVAGGVDGSVYSASSKGTRGIDLQRMGEDRKHEGTVTSVHCHPQHADPRVTELVLTSSTDGTCSLWFGRMCISLDAFSDFIYDLAWCPVHPAVFAAADASGRVTIWNLSVSSVAPVCSVSVRADASLAAAGSDAAGDGSAAGTTSSAVKIAWDETGEHLLCGSSNGEISLFEVQNILPAAGTDAGRTLSEWVSRVFLAETTA